MKSTGIVRKVDELGRIALPIELRRALGIEIKESIEILIDQGNLILTKYEPSDLLIEQTDNLIEFHGKKASSNAIKHLIKLTDSYDPTPPNA